MEHPVKDELVNGQICVNWLVLSKTNHLRLADFCPELLIVSSDIGRNLIHVFWIDHRDFLFL